MPRLPEPLPENRALAFTGEAFVADFALHGATVESLLRARNPHGKPNADVLRRTLNSEGTEGWMIDFPAEMDEREAALYEAPFAVLAERGLVDSGQWRNPHANPALRAALARLPRYLATPADAEPAFEWVDAEMLPDRSLVAVARDDDFAHGVLCSHWFHRWWTAFRHAPDPARPILPFPFPWASDDLGRLTREQTEAKFALARAARAGNQTAIDEAADAAYALSGLSIHGEPLHALLEFHAVRSRTRGS